MSHQAVAWVLEVRVGDPTLKSLLLAIAHRADRTSWACWPSLDSLAFDTEVSKRTIQRRIEELETLGFIRIERRRRPDGTQDSSLITITGGQIVTLCPPVDKNGLTGGQKPGVPVDTAVHLNKQEEQEEQSYRALKEGKPKKDAPYSEDFEALWQAYPRTKNTSKKAAWDIYRMLNAENQSRVRAAVPVFAAAMRAEGRTEDKIKHMQFWLSSRMYETASAPAGASAGSAGPAKPFWETATRKQWGDALLVWSSNWNWSKSWGPEPGKPGCHVPPDILDRFDLKYRGHLYSPAEFEAIRERVSKQAVDTGQRAMV
jgi:hypothetical protein